MKRFQLFCGQCDFGVGCYAGGARFEYGEQQGQEMQTAFSKTLKKMSETGGEISGKS
jgi:hypothetical protein